MSLFSSLGWFKSQRQIEKEQLELEAARVKLDILMLEKDSITPMKALPAPKKPYLIVKLVNDQLTVVLNDGNILIKTNATQGDYQKAREAVTEEELLKLIPAEDVVREQKEQEIETQKAQELVNGIEELKHLDDFVITEGSVYMKNSNGEVINRSLPQLLVERFIHLQNAYESDEHFTDSGEYKALKKFWLKCCLNPNARSAEDLYEFLFNHQFKIDKHGNFYAYRRVVSTSNGNKALVDFVSNTYNKVKAIWKKKPIDFYVWESDDGEFSFSKDTDGDGISRLHGNLKDLYEALPKMQTNMFTSAHTGNEDYKVGEVISMPRNDGDDNNSISCSRGFHAASKAYDYSHFGNTPILVIINPMDVLAVPQNEVGKLRTCRWFFAMTLPVEEEHILDDQDFDTTDLGDVFESKCEENLQGYVQNSFAEEVKRHTFTIPEISATEIRGIILSLDDMKEVISDRVVDLE